MHIVTFNSFKGGTAKTSTVLHLGACLAETHKKKVLLVDLDPQANLSSGLGAGLDSQDTMVAALEGKGDVKGVIQSTCIPGLDLIAANAHLEGIESRKPLLGDKYSHEKLGKTLQDLDYDFVFIDTPPSLGWLTRSAFFAADQSIICAVPEPYSVLGLKRLAEYHEKVNEHHKLTVMGILMTFWDKRGSANKALLDLVEATFPSKCFASKIRRDVCVSRAVLKGKPVWKVAASSKAGKDYKDLAKEFLCRHEVVVKMRRDNVMA
jgi:chromosome partitioning protein